MSYQVLARKWRPQRFEDVIGQRAVTQTLRNAIATKRLAHAFVFAGPRGVGKTTTARILARALNCVAGPTPDPCGACEPCVEIAEGRDIDVLEIDAATHTQVENVREVIIAGLAITPVRDRYKIFIIDEVHQLSSHSFNALLKSLEEPPPHVVFMMATTELQKIPDTILSRSQLFEFRTISTKAISEQLRRIADAEGIGVDEAALALIARAAEGSMRDAQGALDQVIAFAGRTISVAEVSTVLGLVGRDLLLEVVETVASEDAARVFELVGTAVEAGYDLRHVCRELSRVVRDLLVVSIDPSRLEDPEIAPEGDRSRLRELAGRFSREDLMRAFDVLAGAELEIRGSSQPRYHLEMGLLRWIHLQKLTPLADLIEGLQSRSMPEPPLVAGKRGIPPGAEKPAASKPRSDAPAVRSAGVAPNPSSAADRPPPVDSHSSSVAPGAPASDTRSAVPGSTQPTGELTDPAAASTSGPPGLKDGFIAEIKRAKRFFYGTVVAQAQRIEVGQDRVTFTFTPAQRTLQVQVDQARSWLEELASRLAGRKMTVVVAAAGEPTSVPAGVGAPSEATTTQEALRARALADSTVQAMLDVFPAEITDVEEI